MFLRKLINKHAILKQSAFEVNKYHKSSVEAVLRSELCKNSKLFIFDCLHFNYYY